MGCCAAQHSASVLSSTTENTLLSAHNSSVCRREEVLNPNNIRRANIFGGNELADARAPLRHAACCTLPLPPPSLLANARIATAHPTRAALLLRVRVCGKAMPSKTAETEQAVSTVTAASASAHSYGEFVRQNPGMKRADRRAALQRFLDTTRGTAATATTHTSTATATKGRIPYTLEIMVSKLLPGGFGWQASSIMADNAGYAGVYRLNAGIIALGHSIAARCC